MTISMMAVVMSSVFVRSILFTVCSDGFCIFFSFLLLSVLACALVFKSNKSSMLSEKRA